MSSLPAITNHRIKEKFNQGGKDETIRVTTIKTTAVSLVVNIQEITTKVQIKVDHRAIISQIPDIRSKDRQTDSTITTSTKLPGPKVDHKIYKAILLRWQFCKTMEALKTAKTAKFDKIRVQALVHPFNLTEKLVRMLPTNLGSTQYRNSQ